MKGKHFKIVINNFDKRTQELISIDTVTTPKMGPDDFRKFLSKRITQRKKLDKNFCYHTPGFEL